MTVQEIYDVLDTIAPFKESMSFDNTGILIGDPAQPVHRALLCLDVTPDVLHEAKEIGAELILSHHPIIFDPLRSVKKGDRVYETVQSGISVISAHTNLDKAFPYGVNHALAKALGLQNIRGVIPDGEGFIGYMGDLPEVLQPAELGEKIKQDLHLAALHYTPSDKSIRTVCVVGGSGGDYAHTAAQCGADAFVTGEAAHHEAIDAALCGLVLYMAGHYHTEIVYREMLQAALSARCPAVEFCISKRETPPFTVL